MKRLVIQSKFFSCDVKMWPNDIEPFLKGVEKAWRNYKFYSRGEYGVWKWQGIEMQIKMEEYRRNSQPLSEARQKQIRNDKLIVNISSC